MANFVLLPVGGSCATYDCNAATVCLPIREDCDDTPTGKSLLEECNRKWNCNLCDTDEEYYVPFVSGDKIQLQLIMSDLVSPDRTNPTDTDWLTVTLCNPNGPLTSDKAEFLSRWLFGWNGQNNYQIFEVDTSLFTSPCWSILFETADGRQLCSQDFQLAGNCDEETVTIKGVHKSFDCNGFYYGDPLTSTGQGAPFVYDNTIRLRAGLWAIPGTMSKRSFGLKFTGRTVREQWRLVLAEKIPPFIDRLLLKTLLDGDSAIITPWRGSAVNGQAQELRITQFSARNRIDYNNMMLYTADLYEECSRASEEC